jgi:peptide methionine sulfoxide reductase msrA/msrB
MNWRLRCLSACLVLLPGVLLPGKIVLAAPQKNKPMPSNPSFVTVRLLDSGGNLLPAAASPKVVKPEAEWRKQLTPEQYRITRGKGTERAFCGVFYDHKKPGVYFCVCCDLPLFVSDAKFDSGTGWPSFFQPIAKENVATQTDTSHGMSRVEILCARCDAHLGHVFEDGPKPTGLRYCLNSASLVFKEKTATKKEVTMQKQKAMFGAGCFWGVEAAFRKINGVTDTAVGYAGGHTPKPTYKEVCTDSTGHAEVVYVEYDPAKVSYEQLLETFWASHNPTTPNRQGPDVGSQYRSVIFYYTPEQGAAARASKEKLNASGKWKNPVVTEILPAPEFHRAEEYHQRYLEKRGMGSCHLP